MLIHSDFNESFFNEDGSAKDAPDKEYHVAMTRAKKKLYATNIAKVIEIIQ
ncbi:hypothetical protein [Psychrobacter sp.]|uniref:hypothetical protein n=1 Tax=Psychrobacter sp. TaxID=56811 RepID=UPI003568B04F